MALDIASFSPSLSYQGDGVHVLPISTAAQTAAVQRPAPAKPDPVIPSDLQQTIREMQKVSDAFNTHLSFSVNQKLDSIVVKVVDSQTDKVVREIPPAELQHVYEAIRETIGLLFDHKA